MANEKRLIDANVLIETGEEGSITDIFPNWNGFPQSVQNAVCEYGRYIKNLIQEQPTVDAVEVVHGRWVTGQNCIPTANGFRWTVRCGLCGCPQDFEHNYCPNCGAKMDGEGQ